MFELHHGNCLDILRTMPDCSVDAVVTDPPYGLSFMGKRWDYDVPSTEIWAECLRVLKPGGYLLAFAGTRTQHRMAVRIEDAGFEIRDMLAWMYGSGFPKSHNVSIAIDNAAGAKREVVGQWKPTGTARPSKGKSHSAAKTTADCGYDPDINAVIDITAPATEAAKQWQGWGTALKPAMEPITMARKPFKATVAQNVQEWGTGAINIDGCRIGADDKCQPPKAGYKRHETDASYAFAGDAKFQTTGTNIHPDTRWPANVMHDGSAEILQGMGEAARFFYTPKACKDDRDDGCEMMEEIHRVNGNKWTDQDYRVARGERRENAESGPRRNFHPTVKPTDLMRYLCRMVTPTGGIVLDPFTGSGSTGRGAVLEGFRFIGCEMDADYIEIAKARILAAEKAYQPCLIFD
jgi:site-specific DNA-methyltransferase (adenine-specific)